MTTFTWIGPQGVTTSGDIPSDWSPTGQPQPGDTAIVNAGGTLSVGDGQFQSNTAFLNGGTGGGTAAARLIFSGDTSVSYPNVLQYGTSNGFGPSIDGNSTITTAPGPGNSATAPYAGIVDALGFFTNEGSILAAGAAGSSLTINVGETAIGGTVYPGYAVNAGLLEAAAGDTLTINIGANAELFNDQQIVANGGSVLIAVSPTAIAGGLAPNAGVIEIASGGTVETEAAYASTITGSAPLYAFADGTTGDTLKIDNIGSFGGRIFGFQQGDTIDLGTSIAVGTIVYSSATGLLSLEGSGGTVDLVLSTGGFQSGTFAVAGSSADGFTVGTGADGDTILTSTVVIPETDQNGQWSNAAIWSTGAVPGTLATPIIGIGATSAFTLSTTASPVSVAGLDVVGDKATVQIASTTTASGLVELLGGTLTVLGGDTLTTALVRELTDGSDVTIDSGATLLASGHPDPDLANVNGTLGFYAGSTLSNMLGLLVGNGNLTVEGALLAAPGAAGAGSTGGAIFIGLDGSGAPATVVAQGGATVTDVHTILGSDPSSFGVLTLNGAGTTWTDEVDSTDPYSAHGDIIVGYNDLSSNTPAGTPPPPPAGTAQLIIENSATLTEQTGGDIGYSAESAGAVTVSAGGFWNLASAGVGYLGIGVAGSGTLDVLAGGTVAVGTTVSFLNDGSTISAAGVGVGDDATSNGTVAVIGAGALLTGAGPIGIGRGGQGLLQIENGGTVVMNASGAGIGLGTTADAASSGTIMIGGSGAAAELTFAASSSGLVVGEASHGTLIVSDNGTLLDSGNYNSSTGGITVGQSAGASGTILVGGSSVAAAITVTSRGLSIGAAGTGVVEVNSLGTIQLNGTTGIGIGQTTGASGTLIVSGGLLTEGAAANGIGVGQAVGAAAGVEVLNGGTVNLIGTGGISLGASAAASGTLSVSGPNSLFETAGTISVNVGNASSAVGVVNVESGGSLSTARLNIGNATSSTAIVSVTSAVVQASSIMIANASSTPASAVLEINAGGQVTAVSGVNINTKGVLDLQGGTLTVTGGGLVNLNGSAAIAGYGRVSASGIGYLAPTATVVATGGLLELPAGGDIMAISADATLELDQIPNGLGGIVNFATNTPEELILNGGVGSIVTGTITGLSDFDRIELGSGLTATSASLSGGNLTIDVTGALSTTVTIDNVSINAGQSTLFTTGTDSTTGLTYVQVTCFLEGTRIMTADGPVAVEDIRPGMMLPTVQDGRAAPVIWTSHFTVDCRGHRRPEAVCPVRIAPGAFGPGLPEQTLRVSPDHAIFVDGALVPAKLLVNGTSIAWERRDRVTYHHVELPEHAVILAEGLPVESYLDTGDRGVFDRDGATIRLQADFHARLAPSTAAIWETKGAAPLVLSGPRLEAARRRVRVAAEAA
jgi:T5SS/PEP-CTERM-associated repeat protein